MNINSISSDVVEILGKLMYNNNIVKLIGNDIVRPFEQDAKPISKIAPTGIDERFLPLPFPIEYREGIRSQIHVYVPSMTFVSNDIVQNIVVWFDIVVHKDLWLIERRLENNRFKKLIRPYEVAREIANEMKRFEIGERDLTIDLVAFDHLGVNDNYQAIRLEGNLTTWR
jgi:hypothetical protein